MKAKRQSHSRLLIYISVEMHPTWVQMNMRDAVLIIWSWSAHLLLEPSALKWRDVVHYTALDNTAISDAHKHPNPHTQMSQLKALHLSTPCQVSKPEYCSWDVQYHYCKLHTACFSFEEVVFKWYLELLFCFWEMKDDKNWFH